MGKEAVAMIKRLVAWWLEWRRLRRMKRCWQKAQVSIGWLAFYCRHCDRIRAPRYGSMTQLYERGGQSYVSYICEACGEATEVKRVISGFPQAAIKPEYKGGPDHITTYEI